MKKVAIIAFSLNPILWASFYTMAKPGISESSPLLFSTLELLTALPVAIGILLCLGRNLAWLDVKRGIVTGFSLYLVVLLSATALSLTTATETAFFPSLNGLFAALIGLLIIRRNIARWTWIGGVIAAGGVALALPALGDAFLGNIIALAAALAYTGYIYVTDWATKDEAANVWCVLAVELIVMAAFGSGLIFWQGRAGELIDQPTHLYWFAVYVGLATTALPTGISIIFQRYVNPVTTAFLYTFEPLWSAVLAVVLLGEAVSIRSYVGGLCILVGAGVHTLGPIWSSRHTAKAAA